MNDQPTKTYDFGTDLENVDIAELMPSAETIHDAKEPSAEDVREVADQAGWKSREPKPPKQNKIKKPRERFVHRTGRDAQFNNKVHPDVKKAYESIRVETGKAMGQILEEALNVYKRELQTTGSQTPAE